MKIRETFKAVRIGKRWYVLRTTKIGRVFELTIRMPGGYASRTEAMSRFQHLI